MISLVLLLLLIGLPLLVVQLGRQGYWTRLRTRLDSDPATEVLRRHGLAAREAAAVTTAVERGRELKDPALRRAAVELAQLTLDRYEPAGRSGSRGQHVVFVVVAVWLSLVTADVVFALAFGTLGDVNWLTLVGAVMVVSAPIRRGLRLRRAIALNSDRPAARD